MRLYDHKNRVTTKTAQQELLERAVKQAAWEYKARHHACAATAASAPAAPSAPTKPIETLSRHLPDPKASLRSRNKNSSIKHLQRLLQCGQLVQSVPADQPLPVGPVGSCMKAATLLEEQHKAAPGDPQSDSTAGLPVGQPSCSAIEPNDSNTFCTSITSPVVPLGAVAARMQAVMDAVAADSGDLQSISNGSKLMWAMGKQLPACQPQTAVAAVTLAARLGVLHTLELHGMDSSSNAATTQQQAVAGSTDADRHLVSIRYTNAAGYTAPLSTSDPDAQLQKALRAGAVAAKPASTNCDDNNNSSSQCNSSCRGVAGAGVNCHSHMLHSVAADSWAFGGAGSGPGDHCHSAIGQTAPVQCKEATGLAAATVSVQLEAVRSACTQGQMFSRHLSFQCASQRSLHHPRSQTAITAQPVDDGADSHQIL